MQDTPPDGLKLDDSTEDDPDIRISLKDEDKRFVKLFYRD